MRLRTLGARLQAAREKKGIGQSELARRIGVVATTAWRWEHDRCTPRPADLDRLAEELGVSAEWLRAGDGRDPLAATGS